MSSRSPPLNSFILCKVFPILVNGSSNSIVPVAQNKYLGSLLSYFPSSCPSAHPTGSVLSMHPESTFSPPLPLWPCSMTPSSLLRNTVRAFLLFSLLLPLPHSSLFSNHQPKYQFYQVSPLLFNVRYDLDIKLSFFLGDCFPRYPHGSNNLFFRYLLNTPVQ